MSSYSPMGKRRSAVTYAYIGRWVAERDPTQRDAVDEPEAHAAYGQPRDEEADAERGEDEQQAERDPEESEPEGPALPAEVRLEPGG